MGLIQIILALIFGNIIGYIIGYKRGKLNQSFNIMKGSDEPPQT